MFNRKELLRSKEYWLVRFQSELYATLESYMKENGLNRSQLAEKLGVTKGYISQVLNGNYDHRLSKFIELSLAINKAPRIRFEDINQVIDDDEMGLLYEDDNTNRPQIHLNINLSPTLNIINNLSTTVHAKSIEIESSYSNKDSIETSIAYEPDYF
ncbi:MAG TPA: XRE family transcriptional regulator [Bacteroidetes bacterium]|nr:XRE family transcriptional regulator [Bacteroidota bacterium]